MPGIVTCVAPSRKIGCFVPSAVRAYTSPVWETANSILAYAPFSTSGGPAVKPANATPVVGFWSESIVAMYFSDATLAFPFG